MPSDTPVLTARNCPPFLRWAGSKRQLLPTLTSFWTKNHRRYVEPFAGSACMFFALNPPRAILGDLNKELIATYVEVKYRVENVLLELRKLGPANRDRYNELRAADVSELNPGARAARFIYLNRFCFNGIYRTNLLGRFNVPYSGNRCGELPDHKTFRDCSRRLKVARFVGGDFAKVVRLAERGDLVYLDPPYAIRGRRVFREYDPAIFTHEDIKRLRLCMTKLNTEGVQFVVSYAESEEAEILKRGFAHQTLTVRRHIAGFAKHRTLTNEVLITNS